MTNYLKIYRKYKFLLNQLVGRDFKTKYKRSVLGVLWSLLNPLLIMVVQYIVFSALFKWNINNFSVYLLIGTVMFNFFSEATSQALTSITSNSQLITKVYVPLYVFPISKVLSSCINLGFSLIALVAIVLIQGLPLNVFYFLIPYGFVCMIVFSLGMGMILSSMMVFFRDTQFLYGVVLTLWTYLTPLFYPVSILPKKFLIFIQLNPLYYFINYVRTIMLDGKLPSFNDHLISLAYALGTLIIGMIVFKKTKKNFILNI